MGRPSKFPREVRERAVRMVWEHEGEHDSQWSTIRSIAEKMGCTSETLRKWVRQGGDAMNPNLVVRGVWSSGHFESGHRRERR